MADGHVEKTHHDCKCRECNTITAMAERVDAWKTSHSLLKELKYEDDVAGPAPHEVLLLANWLYEGSGDGD